MKYKKNDDACFKLFKEPEELGGEVLQSEKHGIELFLIELIYVKFF